MPLTKDVSFGGSQSFGPPSTQAARTTHNNLLDGGTQLSAFPAASNAHHQLSQMAGSYSAMMLGGRPTSVTPRGTHHIPPLFSNGSQQTASFVPPLTALGGTGLNHLH